LCDQGVGNLVAGAERIFRDSIELFEIRRKNVRDAENRRSKRTAHFVRHVEPLRPYGERVRVRERSGKVARAALGDAVDEFFCGPPHRRPQRLDRLDRNGSADQTAQTRVHGTVAIEHEQLPPARERSRQNEVARHEKSARLIEPRIIHERFDVFVAKHRDRVDLASKDVEERRLRIPVRLTRPRNVGRVGAEARAEHRKLRNHRRPAH